MLREDDAIRLRHMLDAAEKALSFTVGRTRDDLGTDDMLAFALARAIEVIGEAANRMSAEGKNELPSLPWSEMVGMRNRLVHAYFEIDLDRLWDTIIQDLPGLIRELRMAVTPIQDE
jgi:uncharacterized protein with HEPN domain